MSTTLSNVKHNPPEYPITCFRCDQKTTDFVIVRATFHTIHVCPSCAQKIQKETPR